MHEDYEDYDDYNYDDSQDNLDNKYKHYFKFDPAAWDAWGKMIYDAMKDLTNVWYVSGSIPGFPYKSVPVNSYFSNTGKDKNTFQYLGNSYEGKEIWKKKYFIEDALNNEYFNHLRSNAVHFLKQPSYYNKMFEILN